jgi:hypothetical protein
MRGNDGAPGEIRTPDLLVRSHGVSFEINDIQWLVAFADRPWPPDQGVLEIPVLVHVVSQRARVLRLRRTGQPLAYIAAAVLPSSYSECSRHPDLRAFRSSIARPPMPLSTLQETPRDVPCKTRGQDGFATSIPVRLLHPLQHAGLSRRSPVCPSSGSYARRQRCSGSSSGATGPAPSIDGRKCGVTFAFAACSYA